MNKNQVTARGCNRGYIIFVLWHGLEYVRLLKSENHPINFPFPDDIVQKWIDEARNDCLKSPAFIQVFGGTEYYHEDSTTYWTLPDHFFTW